MECYGMVSKITKGQISGHRQPGMATIQERGINNHELPFLRVSTDLFVFSGCQPEMIPFVSIKTRL